MPQDKSTDQSTVDSQQSTDESRQAIPNDAANKESAEGSRDTENAGGISNRPLEEEQENQERVPPRGETKEGGHA